MCMGMEIRRKLLLQTAMREEGCKDRQTDKLHRTEGKNKLDSQHCGYLQPVEQHIWLLNDVHHLSDKSQHSH